MPSETSFSKSVNGNSILLGERKRVIFVGYVAGASYAQRESGNCRRKNAANYDIHISLVARKSDPRCKGIVAEMIPHFRPSTWTPSRIRVITRPVRVSGHLFFDAPRAMQRQRDNPGGQLAPSVALRDPSCVLL